MDRWQQIERIFLAASELPSAAREAFLDRETAGDPELRAIVSGMLIYTGDGASRFVQAIEHTAAAVAASPTHIDRYTILGELGHGGMGTVYLAERTDPEFRQQVAIKLVRHGMNIGQIVERFRHERRILASLEHPNIARLLDGGTTAEGLPYLVMEYVEGMPLVDYCGDRKLPVRDRLLLFEQICAAVQHAHQKLIVHRDIKPANVLVTAAGVPKLLDFGIAKLLMPGEGDLEALTRTGMRLLTPDYASPEQILGDPVSVATDVFSLGAVLYELLTGRRAHQFTSYNDAEFYRVICQTEVTPPSQAVDDPRLKRVLAGDLDNIVAKALRKDPGRRYVSVEQLAADVRRYLDNRPVSARPETVLYRARKFVARNRLTVVVAALAVISLLAGIAGTTLQARRAERRFDQVRKLANSFVFDLYDGMVDVPGTAKIRAKVVSTALEYLDSLAREAGGDDALQMELAAAYSRIGDVQGNPARSGFGDIHATVASYEKGLAILYRLADRDRPDPNVLTSLAGLERTIGFVRLNAGDPARALDHQRRSAAIWERLNPRRGEDIAVDTGLAQAWGMMAKILVEMGESTEAVRLHTDAVALLRGWLPRKTLPNTRGTFSIFLSDLAYALHDAGEVRRAIEAYREAITIRKDLVAKDPAAVNYRRRLLQMDAQLSRIFGHPFDLNLGESRSAEMHATTAFRAAEQTASEDRGSERALADQVDGNLELGAVLLAIDPRRALPFLETARLSANAMSASNSFLSAAEQAGTEEALAIALLATGDRRRGLELLSSAIAKLEGISQRSPLTVDYRTDLIRTLHAQGAALGAAEPAGAYRKAWAAAEAFPPTPRNAREWLTRANVSLRWPRWNAGAPVAERRQKLETALAAWQKLAAWAPENRAYLSAAAETRRLLAALPGQ